MAAIITDDFRKQLAASIVTENASALDTVPDYYIGIGKSDPWTDLLTSESVAGFAPSVPDGSIREREEVKENLLALVKVPVDKAVRVIPRITYAGGNIYKVYNPEDPTCFIPTTINGVTYQPCYVVDQEKIWVCLNNKATVASPLGQAAGSSDVPADDGNNNYGIKSLNSGNYTWAYIQSVAEASTGFNTNQFVKVSDTDLPAGTDKTNADAATGGLLYGIKIINKGVGYDAAPTVTVVGRKRDSGGVISAATLTLSATQGNGDQVTFIDFTGNGGGTDWTDASVVITGGGDDVTTKAEAVPIFAPIDGFGVNPAKDLPSYYVGFEAELVGNLGGDAPIIAYRQLSLLRGLQTDVRTDDADDDAGGADLLSLDALQFLQCATSVDLSSVNVTPGDYLVGNNGAMAFVDYIDTTTANQHKVFFHQNNNDIINRKSFDSNGTFQLKNRTDGNDIGVSTSYTSIGNGEYTRKQGEVVFYENRTAIVRSAQQTEEIKLVIQL